MLSKNLQNNIQIIIKMKKLKLCVVAMMAVVATTQVMAQKVNESGILAKLEKADATLADPKKNEKAATWIKHAEAYFEAASASTQGIFAGAELDAMMSLLKEPQSATEEVVNNRAMMVLVYPYVTLFVENEKVVSWLITREVKADAINTAIDSYAKAIELDPKVKEKVTEALIAISNYCREIGNVSIESAEYAVGADSYLLAHKAQVVADTDAAVDPAMLFYAGYMYAIDGANNTASYAKGEQALRDAIAAGYVEKEIANDQIDPKSKGSIYYYIYHCVAGAGEQTKERLMEVKVLLMNGVRQFPQNEQILEGLMQLYTTTEGIGDPKELIDMIDKTLENNPDNLTTWFGRGRVYFALKDYDECIKSFSNVVRIDPSMFDGQYYLGLFYTLKGDELNEVMKEKTYTAQTEYTADLAAINDAYMAGVPHFEKAMEIRPTDFSTAEYLKSICFRLRDEDGMMDKYNKYNEIFKKLSGE